MKNTKRIFLILIGILLGVAAVVFVLTNKQPVKLTFLYYETLPVWLSVVVLSSLFIGVGLMGLVTLWLSLKHRRQVRRLQRRIRDTEQELVALRNRPLYEADLAGDIEDDDSATESPDETSNS